MVLYCQRSNPWRRIRPDSWGLHRIHQGSFLERFDDYVDANIDLDIHTKSIALKAAPSVVSIVSLTTDDWAFFRGSGIIMDSTYVNNSGTYTSTILTSATALRSTKAVADDVVADDIKIYVHLRDAKFEGHVMAFDFHYNIATIKIESDAVLPTATLRCLDDSRSLFLSEIGSPRDNAMDFQLRPHSNLYDMCPGDKVVAVGRYCQKPYSVMAAPGKFSLDSCEFDCKELFRADCVISKCGIGGPLVNRHGEVIGINFYDTYYTPFLPINIFMKCLEHFKRYGKFCRPSLGMQMTNLYALSIDELEGFIEKFPGILEGVVVEKVIVGSPGESAGIQCNDVIVGCGGNVVRGFLEFYEMIMDKLGEAIEVVLMRASTGERLKLTLDVCEASLGEFNRWPLPEKSKRLVKRLRRWW